MSKPKFSRITEDGITFVFKHEAPPNDDILHIYARHLKNPGDAIYVFFEGSSQWSAKYDAFITTLGNEEVKWFWLEEGKVVMIVHCLDIN